MRKFILIASILSVAMLFTVSSFSQTAKPTIQAINQSEKYTIVDNIFKLEKLFADSSTVRLKTETIHSIDSGTYLVAINFYARWGIYSNEGVLKQKVYIKPNENIKVYLVGGDYSGIYATDPKIEIDR